MLVKMWSSLSISLDPRGCCPTVGQGPNIVMRMFSGPFYLQQSQHRGAFKNDFWPKHEATLVCSTMDGWLISIFSHQGLYNHKNDGEQCHFFLHHENQNHVFAIPNLNQTAAGFLHHIITRSQTARSILRKLSSLDIVGPRPNSVNQIQRSRN